MAIRQAERRRFPRFNYHTPIRYEIVGEPEFDNAVSDDISVGGLSFISHKFIAPATELVLEVYIFSRLLRMMGKIVWASRLPHSDRNKFGIEFIQFDPLEKDHLASCLEVATGEH